MTDPVIYVCTEPECEFFAGIVGLPISTLETRSVALADGFDGLSDGEMPCPACCEVEPRRGGHLLAVAAAEHEDRGTVLAKQALDVGYWAFARPVLGIAKAARRSLEFAGGDGTAASTSFVAGPRVVEGVVVARLPFDGHTLTFGNQDRYIHAKWVEAKPRYGPEQADPQPAASPQPTYVRELQKDLLLLGYFSRSRGTPAKSGGVFDVHTLGAVLAFKRDLVDVYGIDVADQETSLSSGARDAESFSEPIHYQRTFVSPARLLRAWGSAWTAATEGRRLQRLLKVGRKARPGAKARDQVETELAAITKGLGDWPFRVVLQAPRNSYAPFEEKAPTLAPSELQPVAGAPAHEDVKSVFSDPAFSLEGMNTRSKNLSYVRGHANQAVQSAQRVLKRCDEIDARVAELAAAGDDSDAWAELLPDLEAVTETLRTFAGLVRFFVLNISTQIKPWVEHLAAVGSVGPVTGFYLKAMREGARVGPEHRPAYRLALNPGDWGSVDEGGAFIRKECRERGDNRGKSKASTMPEILVLQFFANESRMTFTAGLPPFNLGPSDKKVHFPRLGIDMNSPAKGTFDPVCSHAGEWVFARGWGVGQETEQNTTIDGIELRRGLPVMQPGADAVSHPASFADKNASFDSCLDRKAIARFNNRRGRRDCSYGEGTGAYYDCHGCLKRFYDNEGWLGGGPEHSGGIIVPRDSGTFGTAQGASGFWLDAERLTRFARAGGAEVALDGGAATLKDEFDVDVTALDPSDRMDAALIDVFGRGPSIKDSVRLVAKDRELTDVESEVLERRVAEHMDRRRDLPCSWCHVRIRYAGTGPQAFGALFRMLKVVGNLEADPVVKKHIEEASALRVKEHEEGPG